MSPFTGLSNSHLGHFIFKGSIPLVVHSLNSMSMRCQFSMAEAYYHILYVNDVDILRSYQRLLTSVPPFEDRQYTVQRHPYPCKYLSQHIAREKT